MAQTRSQTQLDDQLWLNLLDELAALNEPVQIQAIRDAHGQLCCGRRHKVRLLGLGEDGALIVERPQARGELEPGTVADLVAVKDGQRWHGRCPVRQAVRARLNEHQSVDALHLDPAEQIYCGQQRCYYRVNTSKMDLKPVLLAPPGTVAPGEDRRLSETVPYVITARMLNISAGGMGLSVQADDPRLTQLQARMCCQLELPSYDDPLIANIQLVHHKPIDHQQVYMGVRFAFNDPLQHQHFEDQILRFATDLERQQLQQRRRRRRR